MPSIGTFSSIDEPNTENSLISRIFQSLCTTLTDMFFYLSSIVSKDNTTESNDAITSTNKE